MSGFFGWFTETALKLVGERRYGGKGQKISAPDFRPARCITRSIRINHAGAVGYIDTVFSADHNFHPAILLATGGIVIAGDRVLLAIALNLDTARADTI